MPPRRVKNMFDFYFHGTPGKRIIDADTGRFVGIFDQDGFLSSAEIAKNCATPLIGRMKACYVPHYPVYVTVWGPDVTPLSDVRVSVAGGGEKTTDENGTLRLCLIPGTYEVTVEKDGFETVSEQVTVGEGVCHLTFSLVLSEA